MLTKLSLATDFSRILKIQEFAETDAFTIESMRSQEYSIGIFIFMVFGIIVFSAILYNFFLSAKREGVKSGKGMKTGERIMFIWLVLGVIAASIFGAAQLLFGHLF
ncbi:MAG: hypothetical protein ACE5EH_02235 [Gammaproteobacteria bacterium]